MNFTEFCEEWKAFPKDKVNRSIEKKEKSGNDDDALKAHTQKAVKNYRTRMTDASKANQKFKGKDRAKQNNQRNKHGDERDKRLNKVYKIQDKAYDTDGNVKVGKKKFNKLEKKFVKNVNKARSAAKRRDGMDAVHMTDRRNTVADDKKQAEINKKSKADRATAKRMLNRAGLEAAYKKPTTKTESMNFTDWQNSLCDPLYEANGEMQCPPGYKFNKKTMRCEPKSKKDDVSSGENKDRHPDNGPGFGVIGSHGQNGAPYAYEEQPAGDGE